MTAAPLSTENMDRPTWMGVLARANAARLLQLFPDLPPYNLLRAPELGAVMVRGRIGGVGQPFNLGEMTVTRCTLALNAGAVGHAYVQGRDKAHSTRAAIIDALMQTDAAEHVRTTVLEPLAAEETAQRMLRATKAAATKVEFFTLVRGEDQ